MMRAAIPLVAVALGGCAHQPELQSISGGECKVFERPEFAVAGRTRYDQNWIDSTIEGGVGGCNWKRPAARPAALDAQPSRARPSAVPPSKKRSLIKRVRDQIIETSKRSAPEPPPIAAPLDNAPQAAPVPDPKPVDPVDVLLGTNS